MKKVKCKEKVHFRDHPINQFVSYNDVIKALARASR